MRAMTKKEIFLIVGIAITLGLCLLGELFRFQGILLLDLWVPIFASSSLIIKAKSGSLKIPSIAWPALAFIGVGTASLLLHSTLMSNGEFLRALFYGVRWASFCSLSICIYGESKSFKKTILWMLYAFAGLLAIAGFIQLQLAPDFAAMEEFGWDPHQGRLLSTWFDPNFVGGALAFLLALMIHDALDRPKFWPILLGLIGICGAALIFTLSRSSYLAFATTLLVLGLLRSWKLLLTMSLALLLAVAILPPVQARVLGLTQSVEALFTDNYTLPDDSARLRLNSWSEGWQLFLKEPVLGQGYNRYKDASLQHKLTVDPTSHAASGSDSSLLTVLATTGVLGFTAFFLIYLMLTIDAWRSRQVGLLAGLCGLFIHAIFVNSLLFPLFMAPFWLAIGSIDLKAKLR
jgi:O-antigen ligase